MSRKSYLMDGKNSSLLWDEETDAWTYYSGDPRRETRETRGVYQAVPTIFRGVTIIADAVGKMPFTIFRGDGDEIYEYTNQKKRSDKPDQQRYSAGNGDGDGPVLLLYTHRLRIFIDPVNNWNP